MTAWPTVSIDDETLDWAFEGYRYLHANPELSESEFGTASYISARLTQLSLTPIAVGPTGVAAVIENGEGPTIAFRADIDALPIEEDTGLPYASKTFVEDGKGGRTGVMHACGHDLHVSSLLGIARTLVATREEWKGTVVLIFQPAEENGAGAKSLVAHGLWDLVPRPSMLLAQHVKAIAAGKILVGSGDVMNLTDNWSVVFRGSGGHASRPQEGVDAICMAAHAIVRLQSIVSRELEPGSGSVVSVGTIHGGVREGVIADKVEFTVGMRSPNEETREQLLSAVRRTLEGEAALSRGAPPEITPMYSFPRCYADPQKAASVAQVFRSTFADDAVVEGYRATGSEDVGRLADSLGIPLVWWWFGVYDPTRWEGRPMPQNHTAQFAPDASSALQAGMKAGLVALHHFFGEQLSESERGTD